MSMATLSVAVAAHPKRRDMVDELLTRLGHDAWAVMDNHDDEWDTHKRAWQSWRTKMATHHLVLQDDALPCPDLLPAVETAVDNLPENSVVSLYFGNAKNHPKIKRAVERADEHDAAWIITPGTWWGVGIIIPTNLIPGMLDYCTKRREVYDRRLSIWCEHGPGGPYPVYSPWPSLVDHLDVDSLVRPGRPPGRRAYRFIGEDVSAHSWDPARGVVECGRIVGRGIKLGKG